MDKSVGMLHLPIDAVWNGLCDVCTLVFIEEVPHRVTALLSLLTWICRSLLSVRGTMSTKLHGHECKLWCVFDPQPKDWLLYLPFTRV